MTKKNKDMSKEIKILLPTTKIKKSVKCKNTEQAYRILRDILNFEAVELRDTEHYWIMGIDATGYVSCIYIAAIGTKNWERLDPTDIFGTAIYYKSKQIYMAHNCNGRFDNINLCIKDFNLMNQLYHACLPFLITIVDHIILTDNTYSSFIENGYMELIFLSDMYKSYIEIEPKIIRDKEEYGVREKEMGKRIGLIEGEQIGVDKGEKKKAIDIAKNLLKNNVSIDIIISSTGLTAEDILKIKADMG